MIVIYDKSATDFTNNGLGTLEPISCVVTETINGNYEVVLTHPIDEKGKFSRIQEERIIKVPVPAGKTPIIRVSGEAEKGHSIYKVVTDGRRLYLRAAPSQSAKGIHAYKPGTEVVVIDNTTNSQWSEVTTPDGRHGWMWTGNLEFVRIESSGAEAEGEIKEAAALREQPFRIYKVEPTLTGITAYARHIFYDLMDNMVASYKPGASTTGAAAFRGLSSATTDEHEFTFYSDLESTAEDVEIIDKNPAEAILDDGGLIEHYGGELQRDWWDVYLTKRIGEERDIQIREGKNLLGIKYSVDITNAVTRVIPKGADEDGNPLYLPGRFRENEAEDKPVYVNHKYGVIEVKEAKIKTKGEDKRTEAECMELMEKAAKEAFEAGCDLPDVTLNVDFIDCAETEEYRQYRFLQGIHMGDTVKVIAKRVGVEVAMRMTQYSYDCLAKKYIKMTLGTVDATIEGNMINPRSIGSGTINGSMIKLNSIGTGQIMDGAVNSLKIALAAIDYAHINEAAVGKLSADAIVAIRAEIHKLVAGEIAADELYADLAKIAVAEIKEAKIDWAQIENAQIEAADIVNLSAEVAKLVKAEVENLEVDWAGIYEADIEWANIANLTAEIAKIAVAEIGKAKINWAQIIDVKIGTADIEDASINTAKIALGAITSALIKAGAIGTAQIADGSITSAKVVDLSADVIKSGTLSTDRLLIKGAGGLFYEINATAGGLTSTQLTEEQYKNAISGTALVARSVTADKIAAKTITANEILSGTITAAEINVANLFAADATIAALNNYILRTQTIEAIEGQLDVWASDKIRLAVDNIRTGGTNLLKASKLLTRGTGADEWYVNNDTLVKTYEAADGFYRTQFSASGLTADAWASIRSPLVRLPAGWRGRQVTLSAYVWSADWAGMEAGGSASAVWSIDLSLEDGMRQNYGSKVLVKPGVVELGDGVISETPLANSTWTRVSMTWTLNPSDLPSGTGSFGANTHVSARMYLRRNGTYIIYAPKLEFGNKATEWSPAPEDAELEIEKLSSELSVQAGKISANTEKIETVKGTANKAATDLTAVTKRVTTAEQTISALDGKIATKVEKTTYEGLAGDVGDLEKVVESHSTLIEQTANDVLIQASRTVGGTNYLRDSAEGLTGSAYFMGNYYFSDGLKPKAGENVTIRIWGSLGSDRTAFGIWNTNGYISIGSLTNNGDGTYSGTFEWKVDSASYPEYSVTEETQKGIQVYALPRTGTTASTIKKIKLERGDYATDWTPHPEDPSAGVNTGENSSVRVKITPDYFNVDVPGEDGDFILNEAGGQLPVLVGRDISAPNVAPRYDGPAVLYVNPNATSSQIAAGNYYRSLADAFTALNYRWVGKTVTINLAAGMTEYGTVSLQGVSGGCWVQIVGSSASRAKLVGRMNLYFNASPVSIAYMNIDSDGTAVNIEGCQTASISHGVFTGSGTGVSGTRGVRSARGSQVVVGECEIYDFERSVYGEMGGSVSGYSCKGNCRVGVNRTTIYLSGTMPCDSTTWAESIWAGQIITQGITVDQGSKPTPETTPTTTAFSYLYSDSYAGKWGVPGTDAAQGIIRTDDSGNTAAIYGVIWFDRAAIQSAIGTRTVKQVSLRLHMQSGYGRGTAVSVQLYGTNTAYSGRSGQPALTKSYGTIGTTNPGEINEITIPAAVINDMASGAIQALVLKSDDTELYKNREYSKNYARFSGTGSATADNCPRLTVVYQ